MIGGRHNPWQSGDAVHVRGISNGGSRIELLDPAGVRVDQQALQADGAFSLQSATRSPGLAMYQLRLRDAQDKAIATTSVPVHVRPHFQVDCCCAPVDRTRN